MTRSPVVLGMRSEEQTLLSVGLFPYRRSLLLAFPPPLCFPRCTECDFFLIRVGSNTNFLDQINPHNTLLPFWPVVIPHFCSSLVLVVCSIM